MYYDASKGKVDKVKKWLQRNYINVNWRFRGSTALGAACAAGHTEVVKLLLTRPGIDINNVIQREDIDAAVNNHNTNRESALMVACRCQHYDIFNLIVPLEANDLLASYVNNNIIPYLVQYHHHHHSDLLEKVIAYHGHKISPSMLENQTITAHITLKGNEQLHQLLIDFKRDSAAVQHRMRFKHGLLAADAAKIFAFILMLDKQWLQYKDSKTDNINQQQRQQHFFSICLKLPEDMQMVVCRRAMGLTSTSSVYDRVGYDGISSSQLRPALEFTCNAW